MKRLNNQICVIGGGAAGLMAAIAAAEEGAEVCVFEKNDRVGKKLLITGKGRCNVTNNCSLDAFLQNVPVNSRFLFSALKAFDINKTMAFFEALGVKLKTERGNRVFPQSDRAQDIVQALYQEACTRKVSFTYSQATGIQVKDGQVIGVETKEGIYPALAVILATGGLSYPKTGSTGDGYRFVEKLGHTVKPLHASLVPLESSDPACTQLQGLSLKNVKVSVFEDGKSIFSEQGEMLFTHFGVSGPLILSASAHMRKFNHALYEIQIDLKPALDEKTLDKRIIRDFEDMKNNDFHNALSKLLPHKLIPVVVERSGIAPHLKVHSVTKQQRAKLLSVLKRFSVPISGPRPISDGIITSGGIDVKEVSPKTMESKLVKGLYFAGEILDVDAYTGGFNLQIAWSTGNVAGHACAQAVLESGANG